jgi:predicted anti-sigma-YlaC factor YlaD
MTLTSGNCERARAWTSLQADGELSELELALLAAHLERCPECRAFSRGLHGVETHLRAQPLESPSRPVLAAGADLRRGSGRSLRLLQAGAAFAVAATGCLGVLVAGIVHVTSERSDSPALQRVSVVDNESPRTMRELRRLVLADNAARATRHYLNP